MSQMDIRLRERLLAKLEEIAGILCKSIHIYDAPGVLSGVSGVALFLFYYSRFTGDAKYAAYGEQALEKAIDLIDNGFMNHTYCTGISGLAWTCEHLARHRFMERKEISFVDAFEPYLLSMMESDFDDGNYDILHGGLGVGYYFLSQQSINSKAVNSLLDGLERTAEKTADNCLKWKSVLSKDPLRMGYNISLSHGMASIIACMAKLYNLHPEFSRAQKILSGTVKYLMQQKFKEVHLSHFPSYSIESDSNPLNYSRLAWCYGDLGIGQALLQAANALGDNKLMKTAADILLFTCNRRDLGINYVVDPSLCHGTAGIAHSFQRIYQTLNDAFFLETAHYWLEKLTDMARFDDGPAGFKTWNGSDKKWINNYSFLEGIPGIGCCLISALDNSLMDWDECLLLS